LTIFKEGVNADMPNPDDGRTIDLDWDNRVLCSDESCIGTIGSDGCCKECGRRYEGELPSGFNHRQTDGDAGFSSPEDDCAQNADADLAEVQTQGDEQGDPYDEWARRTLCRDESCIGVIGEDGCCKECGRPY
jgi:hypothetical protein